MPLTIARVLRLSAETFEEAVEAVVQVLSGGGIVALPTDTIYGVSTLLNTAEKLYRLKNRPQEKPLGLFIASTDELPKYAELTIPRELTSSLLPGPVTLIFKRTSIIPPSFNPGVDNVGIRVPDTPLVQAVCSRLRQPLAQTSANVSGSASPLTVADFKDILPEIDLVIDAGEIGHNAAGSTIVDLSQQGSYHIVRDGIAKEKTECILQNAGLQPL